MSDLNRRTEVAVKSHFARNPGAIWAEDRAGERLAGRDVARGRVFHARMHKAHSGIALAQDRLEGIFELVLPDIDPYRGAAGACREIDRR